MSEQLVYPRIPHDCKKSVKITNGDEMKIILLTEMGVTITKIAKLFNVTRSTIYRKINPEYNQRQLDMNNDNYHKFYKFDKDFVKKNRDRTNEINKNRRKNDSVFYKYTLQLNQKSRNRLRLGITKNIKSDSL